MEAVASAKVVGLYVPIVTLFALKLEIKVMNPDPVIPALGVQFGIAVNLPEEKVQTEGLEAVHDENKFAFGLFWLATIPLVVVTCAL